MGYVGLPLALRFSEIGIRVIDLDIDLDLINKTNQGISLIEHIPSNKIKSAVENELLYATSEYSRISECDGIILCVPTPLNSHREPDLTYVNDTLDSLLPYLKKDQILSLESTTYPGTTEEEIVTRIEALNLNVGNEFFVVYSPEEKIQAIRNLIRHQYLRLLEDI